MLTGPFNHMLCVELSHIDCTQYHAQNHEQLCGDNGITYASHCLYVQAHCQIHVQLASHGACPVTTQPPAPQVTATTTVAQTLTTTAGAPAVTTNAAGRITTTTVAQTTVAPSTATPTTTAPATTTFNPMAGIIQGVFCSNMAAISCTTQGFVLICGTDGQLYPNQCELSKAACANNQLTIEPDQSNCLPGSP
ncbi:uncharacterized protein LOC128224783 [Mya arenaria]|uniref:uncharacterized protein LOC128224783 n=1 Tax=Mya arenaria TaxID=6604 RepID=UPI0022E2A784|nr:uncharacterized protein LOC128224783 [Mya arenaria]